MAIDPQPPNGSSDCPDSALTPTMRPGSAKQTDVEKTVDSDGPLTSAPPPAPSHNNSQPNGGLWAWLQVAGGFCIFFNTWGVLNTFGNRNTLDNTLPTYIATKIVTLNGKPDVMICQYMRN